MGTSGRAEDELTRLERTYSRPLRRKRAVKKIIIITLLLLITALIITFKLEPLVTKMAISNASDLVTSVVNNAIVNMMSEGLLDYDKLVLLEKDDQGHITALITNMAKINALQAEITNAVIAALGDDKYMDISIPVGNIIGGALLSGRGPLIPVRVLSFSNVGTEFVNQFTGAGINQTRHQIMLDVTVNLTVLLPGKSEDVLVVTEVTVAETVIVGDVPEAYADMDNTEI